MFILTEVFVYTGNDTGGELVTVHICPVRDHGFDARRCTINERNGRTQLLSLVTKCASGIRAFNQVDSMMPSFCPR
ncbi:hypothetical protein ACTXT7_005806 [Hymenolepis weldensis]